MLTRLYPSGPGTPQDAPGGAGGIGWSEGRGLPRLACGRNGGCTMEMSKNLFLLSP